MIKNHKIAVVTDFFWKVRGSERMLNTLLEILPEADIFALFGDKSLSKDLPNLKKEKIHFSFLQKIPFIKKLYRYTYFLWPMAIESFIFKDYELIVSLSTSVAKGVVVPYPSIHISYINSPMRYAWDMKDEYFNSRNFSLWKRLVIPLFLWYLRVWDVSSNRADYTIANSNYVKQRIYKYYKEEVNEVINPPVELVKPLNIPKSSFYYYHGAFEPNKNVILLIESAKKYGFELLLTGNGSLLKQMLKSSRGYKNIKIIKNITDEEKWKYYAEAKAFLFPSVEDFGIVSVEALSQGTPVLGYYHSGTSDIVQEGINGVLIESLSEDAIWNGITKLNTISFNREVLIKSGERFSKQIFQEKMVRIIKSFLE